MLIRDDKTIKLGKTIHSSDTPVANPITTYPLPGCILTKAGGPKKNNALVIVIKPIMG